MQTDCRGADRRSPPKAVFREASTSNAPLAELSVAKAAYSSIHGRRVAAANRQKRQKRTRCRTEKPKKDEGVGGCRTGDDDWPKTRHAAMAVFIVLSFSPKTYHMCAGCGKRGTNAIGHYWHKCAAQPSSSADSTRRSIRFMTRESWPAPPFLGALHIWRAV